MKKLILYLAFAAMGYLLVNCNKKEDSCAALAQQVTLAGQLYASNPSVQNCGQYKAAIQAYLNSSCSNSLSSADRTSLQNKYNNLPC